MDINRKISVFGVLAVIVGICAFEAFGCTVPVFRYALERWQADPYPVEIIHNGPLGDEAKKAIDKLKLHADREEEPSNIFMRVIDGAKVDPNRFDVPAAGTEEMTVYLPPTVANRVPVWKGRATVEAAGNIIQSPARKEIVRRIVDGQSAVWVLLESGDKKADDEAEEILTRQLKVLQDEIELPADPFAAPGSVDLEIADEAVKIEFSLIRVSREDQKEKFFVESLLHTEPDLAEIKGEPMAFAMFGRGRVLYALVGKGINDNNIARGCVFLCGPCACEIKMQNPGVDLLMTADWDNIIDFAVGAPVDLPLIGYTELIVPDSEAETDPNKVVEIDDNTDTGSDANAVVIDKADPETIAETTEVSDTTAKPIPAEIEKTESIDKPDQAKEVKTDTNVKKEKTPVETMMEKAGQDKAGIDEEHISIFAPLVMALLLVVIVLVVMSIIILRRHTSPWRGGSL